MTMTYNKVDVKIIYNSGITMEITNIITHRFYGQRIKNISVTHNKMKAEIKNLKSIDKSVKEVEIIKIY